MADKRKPEMGWFKTNTAILRDRVAQTMPAAEYRRQVLAAFAGETVYLSKFIRPCSGRPPAHEWEVFRREVFERDDYTCTYCGERGGKLECDHIVPVAKGGQHEPENLTTACFKCNRSKRDKTLEEWKAA